MTKNKAIILYLFWVFLNLSFLIYSNEKELGYFSYFHCFFFSIFPVFLYFFIVSFNWIGKIKLAFLFVLRYLLIIKPKISTIFYGIINGINDKLYVILKVVFGFIFCLGLSEPLYKTKEVFEARASLLNSPYILNLDNKQLLMSKILNSQINPLLSKSKELQSSDDYQYYASKEADYNQIKQLDNQLSEKNNTIGLSDSEYDQWLKSGDAVKKYKSDELFNKGSEKKKQLKKIEKEIKGVYDLQSAWASTDKDMQERLANSRHYKAHQSDMFLMNGFIVKFVEFGFCTAKTFVNLMGRQDLGVELSNSIANISEATTGVSLREQKVFDKILNGLAYILAVLVFFNGIFQLLNRNTIVGLKLELFLNAFFLVSLVFFFINYYHIASLSIIIFLVIVFILFLYFAFGLVKRIKGEKEKFIMQ
jgi:hypothetical protein